MDGNIDLLNESQFRMVKNVARDGHGIFLFMKCVHNNNKTQFEDPERLR